MTSSDLIHLATSALSRAYAPYSRFSVAAALLSSSGEVFLGVNVENLSYGLTLCAERTAFVSAIAAGHRSFTHLAVVADTEHPISPCGACRQVAAEFAMDLQIISANLTGAIQTFSLSELLPRAKTGILNHE